MKKPLNMKAIVAAAEKGANVGWCVKCGAKAGGGVEPDARKYECAKCHAHAVYGAEELALMMAF